MENGADTKVAEKVIVEKPVIPMDEVKDKEIKDKDVIDEEIKDKKDKDEEIKDEEKKTEIVRDEPTKELLEKIKSQVEVRRTTENFVTHLHIDITDNTIDFIYSFTLAILIFNATSFSSSKRSWMMVGSP